MNWEQTNKVRRRYENKYKKVFKSALLKQISPVINELNTHSVEQVLNKVKFLIKEDDIFNSFSSLYNDVGLYFHKETRLNLKNKINKYQTKGDEELNNNVFKYKINDYIKTKAGKRITWITEETENIVISKIKNILLDAEDLGLSAVGVAELTQKELYNYMVDNSFWRSLRIATTEIVTSSNAASLLTAKEFNVPLKKIWLTGGVRIRETHSEIDNTFVNINDYFNVPRLDGGVDQMEHPGDPNGSAGNVVNCKCTLIYENY